MSQEPLRVGIVGAGRMGVVHGHLLQLHPDTELVGFVEPDASVGSALASQGLRAPVSPSLEGLLGGPAIDALFICTPTHTHRDVIRECAARGAHLFVEKPVATNLADAEAILKLAEDAGVVHSSGYVYAHLPIVERARELLQGGVIGEALRFSSHAFVSEVFGPKKGWFFRKDQSGGGVVANMASHLLFVLGWYFGEPRRVVATTRSHFSSVEDSAQALLGFDGGLEGMLDASWSVPSAQMLDYGLTVSGARGTLFLARETIRLHLLEPAEGFPEGWSEVHASELPADSAFDISPHIGGEAFYRQLQTFVDACRSGRQPFCSLEESCRTQRMIDAIYASAETGQPVELP